MNGRQDFTFDRSRLLAGTLQNLPTGLVMAAGNYGDVATPLLLPTPSNVMRTNLSDMCRSSPAVGLAAAHQQYGRCTSSFSWNTGENFSSLLNGANFGSVASPVPPLHNSTDAHKVRTMWSPVTSNANGLGHYCMASGLYSLFPLVSGNDMTTSPCSASSLSRNSFLHQSFHHSCHSSKDLMLSSGIHLETMLPFAQQLSHSTPTFTTLSQEHSSPLAPYYTKGYESSSFQKRDAWSESHKNINSDNNNNSNICSKLSDYQHLGSQSKDQISGKPCESRSKKSKACKAGVNKCESLPSMNRVCNKVELSVKKLSDRTLHPRCQTLSNKRKKSASDNFISVQSEIAGYSPNDNVALNLSRNSAMILPSAKKVNESVKRVAPYEIQPTMQTNLAPSAQPTERTSSAFRSNVITANPAMDKVLSLAATTAAFTRTTNTTTTTTSTTVVTSCVNSSRPTARTFIQPLTISMTEETTDALSLKKTRKHDTDKLLHKVPDKTVTPVSANNQISTLNQPCVQVHPSNCTSKNNRRIFVSNNANCDATPKHRSSSLSILKTSSKKVIHKPHTPSIKLHPIRMDDATPIRMERSKKANVLSDACEFTQIPGSLKCNTYTVEPENLVLCSTEESSTTLLSSPTPSLPCNSSAFASSISPSYSTIAEDLWKASENVNESQADLTESPAPLKSNLENDCDKKKNQKNDDIQVTPVSLETEDFSSGTSVTESIKTTLSNTGISRETISLPCKPKDTGQTGNVTTITTTSSNASEKWRLPLYSVSKITEKSTSAMQNNVQKVQPIPMSERALPLLSKQQSARNVSTTKNSQVVYPADVTTSSTANIYTVATTTALITPTVSNVGVQPANTVASQPFSISALPKTISCTLSLNSVPVDAVAVTDQSFLAASKITPLETEAKTNLSVAQVVPVNMIATSACEKPALPIKAAEPLPENSIVLHNPTVSVNIPIGIAVARQRHEHTTTQTTGIVASAGTWDENSRTALAPWITSSHTSTYWLPQNNYAATTAPFPLQFNSPDLTHLPFPPMGFQLVRDSITGHLLLIPTNIDLTDRTAVWPNYTTSTTQLQSTQPCQQVLIQQHVLQQDQAPTFEYRLPVTQQVPSYEPAKTQTTEIQTDEQSDLETTILEDGESAFTDHFTQKADDKDKGVVVCSSVDASTSTQPETPSSSPSISGSTNSYNLDDYGNADVLQLAQAVQTDSGKRSQGTSPIPPDEYTTSSMEQIAQTVDDADSYDDNSRLESDFSCQKEESPQVADASNQTDTPPLSEVEDIGEETTASFTCNQNKNFISCGTETCDPSSITNDAIDDNEEIDSHGLELLSNSIKEHVEGTNQEKPSENQVHLEDTGSITQENVDEITSPIHVDDSNIATNFTFQDASTSTAMHVAEESQAESEVPENMQGLGGLGLLCALAEQCFVEVKSKDGHVDAVETSVSEHSGNTSLANHVQSALSVSELMSNTPAEKDAADANPPALESISNAASTFTEMDDDTMQNEDSFEKSNGLGLLAEFACCVAEETDKQNVAPSDCTATEQHTVTDNQDGKASSRPENGATGVKRKPGRPKKPYVKLTSLDGIPLKRMKIEIKPISISQDEVITKPSPSPPKNLSPNLSPPKVSFLEDDAWHRRRSERIFLNDLNINPAEANKATALSPPHLKPMTEEISICKEKPNPPKNLTRSPEAVKNKKSTTTKIDLRTVNLSKKTQKPLNPKEPRVTIELFDEIRAKCKLADDSRTYDMTKSDSESSNCSSQEDDDNEEFDKQPPMNENQSWLIKSEELVDKLRVLTLKDGLFYAGHINAIRAPDVYGITYVGERGNRPHIYSREEILKIALLETKVDDVNELSEGMRICAYWSQQYRCLYPGTVKKCDSPDPEADEENTVYVEFDDGDSGRIPITDIRLLHHTFPVVSYDPNPLVYTGKRRYRLNSESSSDKKNESIKKKRKSTDSLDETVSISSPQSDSSRALCKSQTLVVSERETAPSESVSKNTKRMPSLVISTKLKMENEMKKKIKRAKLELKRCKSLEKMQRNDSRFAETAVVSPEFLKAKKHKKHKDRDHSDEHRHHRHHRHHHHHHKHKHKHHDNYINCTDQSQPSESTNLRIVKAPHDSHRNADGTVKRHQTFTAERKPSSELTVKIRTSSTELSQIEDSSSSMEEDDTHNSSDDCDEIEEVTTDVYDDSSSQPASKANTSYTSSKRKKRPSSIESKSKMAAFLPARQLWRWSGNSFKRPKTKGKARKTFYKAITRGKETIVVGDCAVFLSTGRPHLPYIGRIETMWEAWGGNMIVRVKWFYHPEETKGGRRVTDLKGALYQSLHVDENDVQTISHKCEVLSWSEYKKQFSLDMLQSSKYGSIFDNNDIYYLAGTYDPTTGYVQMAPGICS